MQSSLALDSGTWADWANVAVTALSFGIAFALFFIGLRDRRRADVDRLRGQARKVWVWMLDYSEELTAGARWISRVHY